MKRTLLVIMLLAMTTSAVLATKCTTYYEAIRVDIWNVPGITGSLTSTCYKQQVGSQTYILKAAASTTTTTYYRINGLSGYFLDSANSVFSGATLDGELLIWPAHEKGDTLTIKLYDGPCSCGMYNIDYQTYTYIPLLLSEAP